MVAATADVVRREGRFFYVGIAVCCAMVAFGGFLPTYWVKLASGTFHGTPIQHLHGALFFTWYLFFASQTLMVATGRLSSHRSWGLAGISLATAMAFSMVMVTLDGIAIAEGLGLGEQARRFAVVPLGSLPLFALFFISAIVNVQKPALHKRLMVLASVPLLQAAMARVFLTFLAPPDAVGPPPVAVTIAPGLAIDLLLVAAMLHDRRVYGRVHWVYKAGVILVLIKQLSVVPLSQSGLWMQSILWLESLGG